MGEIFHDLIRSSPSEKDVWLQVIQTALPWKKWILIKNQDMSITIKGPLSDCILGFRVGHGHNVLPGISLVLMRLVDNPLRLIQP